MCSVGEAQVDSRALQTTPLLRLYAAKSENGPDASICATLTRQRNGSPLAGSRIASCVIPPPFFQGVAVKEALRMICSLEFCTRVFYTRPICQQDRCIVIITGIPVLNLSLTKEGRRGTARAAKSANLEASESNPRRLTV